MTHLFPNPLIDLATLPAPLLTSDPNSFAYRTFKTRIPRILSDAIAINNFEKEQLAALESLYDELVTGIVQPLRESTSDADFWNTLSTPHLGRSWLDVPWFWAETYFYRRLLEATGYFRPGPGQGVDPFAPAKNKEYAPSAAPATAALLLGSLPTDPSARFIRLFHASLWGNRADLSLPVAAHLGAIATASAEADNLLVDDTAQVWAHLQATAPAEIVLIADNAGAELLMDLLFVDFLLAERLARCVTIHLKPQPFFVSDAMPVDVEAGLEALATSGATGEAAAHSLRRWIARGQLRLHTSWFYPTPLFFFQPPAELRAAFAAADLVIAKGDLNYRRLLGDARWPPTWPFAQAISYFPAPVVALRTLKSEIIVGLQPGQAEDLSAADPDWRVNGRRGVIQARIAS